MNYGLTSQEVLDSRNMYGTNKLPEKKLKTPLQFFMETFEDRLNQILLGMMVVFAILAVFGQGSYSEPIGVGVVLLAIAFIGMKTGMKSQKSAKELKDRTSLRFCNVIRDGKIEHINADDIVVGDLVIVQSGEAIPADGYLIEGNLKVDNSVLNGESESCKKHPITDDFTQLWVQKNIKIGVKKNATANDFTNSYSMFSGTTVTDGEGKMIVTQVGENTVNGQTIMTIDEIEEQKTSLDIQLEDLAGQISKFGYIGAIVILVVLVIANIIQYGGVAAYLGIGWIPVLKNILTIAVTALTIIVAAVPEGLPLIINLITAQNAKVMIKHNVLAKHTNKIPEAGNIQLLCTDKTGTLTVGKLVPVYNIMGNIEPVSRSADVARLFKKNIVMNSSAMYDESGEIVGGNATERALLTMVPPEEYESIRMECSVVNKQNFNSANKYSAVEVVAGTEESSTRITFYKGAPEKLLAKAIAYIDDTGKHELNKELIRSEAIDKYTSQAMRVIATAYSESGLVEDELPDDLVITSFVAIRDDVRAEVPEAVRKMHGAGVQVMMVTGDVLSTAKAIARDAGLIEYQSDICMSADDFDSLSDDEAKELLPRIKVIARATPNTKLRIVKLAQGIGLCVGMTGDGTNDAPALKAADVGFSMGSGTDVCKEAGDIIITDDNFVSITDAVLLGRTFMHNVLKFLKFQLPINVGLVILSILYPAFLGIEAIAAVQILIINIVMDSLNSLSFGGEPAKDEYMIERPIPKGSKLLSRETVSQIAVSVCVFIALFVLTLNNDVQRVIFNNNEAVYATARFVLLIFAATLNGFNIRTDSMNLFNGICKNKLFIQIACMIFLMTFMLAQFGGEFVGCAPMNMIQWMTVIGLSLVVIPCDLIRKYIVYRKK